GTDGARSKEGIARAGKAALAIKKRLVDAGFEVQTTRLALAPAYTWMAGLDTAKTIEMAKEIEVRANEAGIDYVSLGPVADSSEQIKRIESLDVLIAATQSVFASVVVAQDSTVNAWALQPVANAIKRISNVSANGFGNLRFAAIANCKP